MNGPMVQTLPARGGEKGFSLVELLITMAVFSLVVSALFTLYLNMQRTTLNQEDIVDIQQGARIAIQEFTHDVRMAGFVVPDDTTPVAAGSNATTLNLVTGTALYDVARIADSFTVDGTVTAATVIDITVASTDMAERFVAGDTVRIIRPDNGSQPVDVDLVVDDVVGTTVKVRGFNNTAPAEFVGGDLICRINPGAPDPSTISWAIVGGNLVRLLDGGATAATNQQIVAGASALAFTYILEDGTETAAPTADQREEIVAVQMVLTVDTPPNADGAVSQRSVATVARLRN